MYWRRLDYHIVTRRIYQRLTLYEFNRFIAKISSFEKELPKEGKRLLPFMSPRSYRCALYSNVCLFESDHIYPLTYRWLKFDWFFAWLRISTIKSNKINCETKRYVNLWLRFDWHCSFISVHIWVPLNGSQSKYIAKTSSNSWNAWRLIGSNICIWILNHQ